MYDQWFKWWSGLFENSFNYYYNYAWRMFNQDVRLGTDDDIVVMGDVTIVLPRNKTLDNATEIKEQVLEAVRQRYKANPALFSRS